MEKTASKKAIWIARVGDDGIVASRRCLQYNSEADRL